MRKYKMACNDINLALLLIRSTPVGLGLPSSTTLFNRPILGLMPRVCRMLINYYSYEDNHDTLKSRHYQLIMNNDTCEESLIIPVWS